MRRLLAIGAILLPAIVAGSPASAYPRPGLTERASVTADGSEIGGGATSPSISDDGRFVAFVTDDNGVVPDDQNGLYDVFVRDRLEGITRRVSVGSDGQGAKAMSLSPRITGDGRYVLFVTSAAFDPRDSNRTWDPYIRDLQEGTTTMAVVTPDGESVPWGIGEAHMSDDTRTVVFATGSAVLAEDTNSTFDVYAFHRETGEIELVSARPDGQSANGESYWNDLSGNGRYAVFYSFASDVITGDTNGATDVFVRDLETDKTIRVSVASDGAEGNTGSVLPAISEDGRYVAFVSYSSNLVAADGNPINDVYVHDLVTRRTERVSVSSDGTEPGGAILNSSWAPTISASGRYVAFGSSATNLVEGDTNGVGDFFVHDRFTGTTERVSVAGDGSQMTSNNSSAAPAISSDGRFVAFTANGPNLVSGDMNGDYDVFVRDRGPEVGIGGLTSSRSGARVSLSGWATYSGDVVASVADDDRDGRRVAPGVSAAAAGAELIGVRIAYRPEAGNLLLRWEVTRLPGVRNPGWGVDLNNYLASAGAVPSVSGAPGILYGLELTVGSVRYEVRSLRAGVTAAPPGAPMFALYRCGATCEEAARLTGSFGTTGEEVRALLPLEPLGLSDPAAGGSISDVRGFVAQGEAAAGAVQLLDEAEIGDVVVPALSLEVGVAERDTPGEEVEFLPWPLAGGRFEFSTDHPDPADAWVRGCLGDRCGAASAVIP